MMQKPRAARFFQSRSDDGHRRCLVWFVGLMLIASSSAWCQTAANPSAPAWTLVWSDEFNSTNGSAPDPAKWVLDTGGDGWGNHELEYYTARPQNIRQQDGNLVITALHETYTGPDKVAREYTSGRLKTAGLFTRTYGRFEARIKIPSGKGMWPAFWMLGNDMDAKGWPGCGEIDIMENVGNEPSTVHGSLHGPGYAGMKALTGSYPTSAGRFSNDFHVFAVEWEPNTVRFYVDGSLYETRTPRDLPAEAHWAFDHPFFILLNLAVGGSWPGNPDPSTVFPQTMLVDYVRVYERK